MAQAGVRAAMSGEEPVQAGSQTGARHVVSRAAGAVYRSIVERLAGSHGDYEEVDDEEEPVGSEVDTAEAESASIGATEGGSTVLVTPRESVFGTDYASLPSIPRSVRAFSDFICVIIA